jgi:DNA-binding GntR family transcriptional regulator
MTKRQQVAEELRRRIADGAWNVGEPLPGVGKLAREYGCSVEVARQAIHLLADWGLVRRPHQGWWTRVIAVPDPEQPNPRELLAELQETVRALGARVEALAAALGGA